MKSAPVARVVVAIVFAGAAVRAEPVSEPGAVPSPTSEGAPASEQTKPEPGALVEAQPSEPAPARVPPAATSVESAQPTSGAVSTAPPPNTESAPTVKAPRPRKGFTIGFAVGVGFGSFRIDDPVDVPVTLEKTTTSGGITTTTTAESTLFVKAKGEGALVMADFRCGLMLTPDVAALLDFAFGGMFWEGLTIPDESDGAEVVGVSAGERGTPIQLHVGASAQVFVVGPLWVRGGFGLGVITYDRDPDSEEGNASSVGAGVLASVGVQLSQKWITDRSNKAPSLEIQYLGGPLGTNAYAHGATVGVGYQWY